MRYIISLSPVLSFCLLVACNQHQAQAPDKPQDVAEASQTASHNDVSSVTEVVPPLPQEVVSREAAAFITALKADDPAIIRAYFPSDYPEVELKPDAPDMLFIRDRLRPLIAKGAMDGREMSREGHIFSVLFYRKPFANRLEDRTYLESDYMKTFFVCNFDDTSGRWILSHPIMCFDETEGPYEQVGY
ncbi:MAG: hypothetical protein NVV72_03225 [Asticcacaulis sp.]|nr:hypothetical protein [Asticcacaulis sp.]